MHSFTFCLMSAQQAARQRGHQLSLAGIQSSSLKAFPLHRGASEMSRAASQHQALASQVALASQTSGIQPGSQGPIP